MLTPSRSLSLSSESGRELPRVPAFAPIYHMGVRPRHGEVVMIAGRSGTQKSGFALYWTVQTGLIAGLRTLYFSADMSPFTASARVASMVSGSPTESVEAVMLQGGFRRRQLLDSIAHVQLTFAFGALNWPSVDEELEAYVELWDAYPDIIVFDNLMDFDSAEADYAEQMAVMSNVTARPCYRCDDDDPAPRQRQDDGREERSVRAAEPPGDQGRPQ